MLISSIFCQTCFTHSTDDTDKNAQTNKKKKKQKRKDGEAAFYHINTSQSTEQ